MTTEIKELSRAYQLWLIIKDNPGIKMPDVAKAMGSHTKNISDAITKMVKAGNICTQGKKGIRTYTANKSSPPVMYGRVRTSSARSRRSQPFSWSQRRAIQYSKSAAPTGRAIS